MNLRGKVNVWVEIAGRVCSLRSLYRSFGAYAQVYRFVWDTNSGITFCVNR